MTLFQNEFGMGVCVDCEVDAQKAKKAKKKTTTKRKKVKR